MSFLASFSLDSLTNREILGGWRRLFAWDWDVSALVFWAMQVSLPEFKVSALGFGFAIVATICSYASYVDPVLILTITIVRVTS